MICRSSSVFEFFAPIGFHGNENENKNKIGQLKFHKTSGPYHGKQQLKFERSPHTLGTEIIVTLTDNGQMMDKVPYHELCSHSQAELTMALILTLKGHSRSNLMLKLDSPIYYYPGMTTS